MKKIVAGNDGHFTYPVDFEHDYKISATKEGFFFSTMAVGQVANGLLITLELDSLVIGKAIVIDNILYDLDKSEIRPDAAITLDNVVKVMNENPKIRVELSSHTDCRADNNYNKALSDRRASAAVDYLIKRGIVNNRMTAKGYGESMLMNRCSDGVNCSEEEHQLNRRTEFKVTSMDK